MPIYEYACAKCAHEFETLQKIGDEPLAYCPACGEAALRKKVSAAAFRLKGTGWYETDFKSNAGKDAAKTSKPDAADAKPASKPESRPGSGAETKSAGSAAGGDRSNAAA